MNLDPKHTPPAPSRASAIPPASAESIAKYLEAALAAHERKRKNRSPFVVAWYRQAIELVRTISA